MTEVTEYRVVSESEGHITEYDSRDAAEVRAKQMNAAACYPDDHRVEECREVYSE